jgi:hypothetical protein
MLSVPYGGISPSRAKQSLGGYTPVVEAIPSQEMSLHKCNLCSKAGCSGGRDESGSTCANDYQIIALTGLGIFPIWRMCVGYEFLVVFIVVKELDFVLQIRWSRLG